MDGQPVRILVVDDHSVVRHGLIMLLARHPDLVVVGEAESGNNALLFLAEQELDVILLDIQMKGASGLEVAKRVRQTQPAVKIIILTTYGEDEYVREAMAAGVDAFLLKSASHDSLPDVIRGVMQGEKFVSPSLMSQVLDNYQKLAQEQARREAGISPEELELLAAIAEGLGNKELAECFYLSEATVKRKVQEIVEKLGAANRTQAVAEAIRRGWV